MKTRFLPRTDVVYASFFERSIALVIDIVLLYCVFHVGKVFDITLPKYPLKYLFLLCYFSILESKAKTTIGKAMLKIKIVNFYGGNIRYSHAFFRGIIKVITIFLFEEMVNGFSFYNFNTYDKIKGFTSFIFCAIFFISFFMSSQKQPIYDRYLGVFVIKK